MAGGKETPRQKMIGMMYLVLTALLALNVSKDILEAFVRVNKGLEATNASFTGQNGKLYAEFDVQKQLNPEKVTPYYNAAQEAKELTNQMYEYIYELKKEIVKEVDKVETEQEIEERLKNVSLIEKKDDYDTPTHLLVGDGSTNVDAGRAAELKKKLAEFRENMLGLLDKSELNIVGKETIKDGLSDLGIHTEDPKPEELSDEEKKDPFAKRWETRNFYHNVAIASITILTNMQNDVRNAESRIVNTLLGQISASDFKFDTLAAKVIAPTSYVLLGEEYQADIFVAAFSTTQNPSVKLGQVDTAEGKAELIGDGDTTGIIVDKGVGTYTVRASSEGLKTYSGVVEVKSPSGEMKQYPFFSEYMVAKPTAVVSPDKMNVFYIGVDNPVSVSAPGVAMEALNVSISNGSITPTSKSQGKYVVKVSGGGEAVVSVSTKTPEGGTKSLGKSDFRVKRVPDPVAYIASQKDGLIPAGKLVAAGAVIPKMENFDFDLNFRVTAFELSMNVGGDFVTMSTSGNRLSAEMANRIKSAKRNTKIYIEEIKAVGPDGIPRKLAPINLKLQ